MYQQAQKILNFDRQLHVKLPTCTNGIKTLDRLLKDGVNVNMTLGFDQNQALAVSQTAINSQKNQVYFSCFVGRLFDNGIDGIENLVNIKSMFEELNTPVQLLACSFRNLDQFLAALAIEVDIVTVSIELLREWKKHEFLIPKLDSFHFKEQKQTFLPIIELDSDKVNNPLTLSGMNKFASDWNKKIS
jgi:transaldolase